MSCKSGRGWGRGCPSTSTCTYLKVKVIFFFNQSMMIPVASLIVNERGRAVLDPLLHNLYIKQWHYNTCTRPSATLLTWEKAQINKHICANYRVSYTVFIFTQDRKMGKKPIISFLRTACSFLKKSWVPKDALCQVWLKLAHWFWRRFFNFVNVFSLKSHSAFSDNFADYEFKRKVPVSIYIFTCTVESNTKLIHVSFIAVKIL